MTRGLAVDDPRTTILRRRIIASKPFLRQLYSEWYRLISERLDGCRRILELGSGGGFFKEHCPAAITSEVFHTPGIDLVADARALPFAEGTLDAIMMTDVFHHLPDVTRVLTEAGRCVRPGGKLVMLEPWHSPWSQWVYTHLHPEPFEPLADWTIPATGPLSGANGALPWIVFARDAERLARDVPTWRVVHLQPLMPFAYLLSGGVSLRALAPGWLYRPVRALESRLDPARWAMFALIELERRT
ncbi:MAG: class I SAM-dependent methyltransferase [Sphingobacteriia bacterium]|nr:class I SAM-dependent methyltransferase [Sphingobacteriia bacterium]NCC40985.1 class I SAM-dependent methyltransferase [Gammaproteobacteria bacterium]